MTDIAEPRGGGRMDIAPCKTAFVVAVETNFTGWRDKKLFFIGLMRAMTVRAHPRFHRRVLEFSFEAVIDVTAETYVGHRCTKKLSLR